MTGLMWDIKPGWADGTLIEIAWHDAKVGILPDGHPTPRTSQDWLLKPSGEWSAADLLAVFT